MSRSSPAQSGPCRPRGGAGQGGSATPGLLVHSAAAQLPGAHSVLGLLAGLSFPPQSPGSWFYTWPLQVGPWLGLCRTPFSTPPHTALSQATARLVLPWAAPFGRRAGGKALTWQSHPPPGSLPSPARSPQPFLQINGPGTGWGPVLRMSWVVHRGPGLADWRGWGLMGPRGGWRPGQWQQQQGLHGRGRASHQDPDP